MEHEVWWELSFSLRGEPQEATKKEIVDGKYPAQGDIVPIGNFRFKVVASEHRPLGVIGRPSDYRKTVTILKPVDSPEEVDGRFLERALRLERWEVVPHPDDEGNDDPAA